MKSCLKLIAIALGLGLSGTAAQAMSELGGITVTPLWPTNANPGNTMRYEVMVERLGQGVLKVEMSTGLPAGCHVSFSAPVRFTGRVPEYEIVIMTVTTDNPTAIDSCNFTVTATAQRESVTWTNQPCAISHQPILIRSTPCDGGNVEVQGLGGSCKCQHIESTTDLANPNWTPVGDCTADGNGRFLFIHNQAQTGCTQRFYRAVTAAPEN